MTAIATRDELTETITDKVGMTVVEPRFNLRRHVEDVLASGSEPDPGRVAAQVIAGLSDADLRIALAVTLPDYIRNVAGSMAVRARKPQPRTLTTPQRIASWYASILASRTYTGSEWKFLRDCTADDLHGAAAERYRAATATKSEADRLTTLADLLEELGAETVAEVPEPELRRVLGGAA